MACHLLYSNGYQWNGLCSLLLLHPTREVTGDQRPPKGTLPPNHQIYYNPIGLWQYMTLVPTFLSPGVGWTHVSNTPWLEIPPAMPGGPPSLAFPRGLPSRTESIGSSVSLPNHVSCIGTISPSTLLLLWRPGCE